MNKKTRHINDNIKKIWGRFLDQLDGSNELMLAGALEGSIATAFSGDLIHVAIPEDHAYSLATLRRPSNHSRVAKLLAKGGFPEGLEIRYMKGVAEDA